MDKYNLEKIVKNLVDEAIIKEVMSLQLAVKLIEAVEQKAQEMGMRVVIAVSDAAGRPVAGYFIGKFFYRRFFVGPH